MKKIAAIAALSASTLGLSAAASFADYTLNILHINDWHSRIESNNKFESTCSAEEEGKGECIGGAARLVTAIDQDAARSSKARTCCCSTAATISRDRCSTRPTRARSKAEFLNQMKFDAMTVGNHEFDDGEDALVPFLDMIKFPVLSRQREGKRAVQGRRPHQAVDRARGRRPEDRHHRRGHQRHAGGRLARPEHHHRGRRQDDHRRGREAEGRRASTRSSRSPMSAIRATRR